MPIAAVAFARAIWSLRHDAGFVALAGLTSVTVIGASVFYWLVEHLGPLDAVCLAVMTVTTVGYGDVSAETAAGKAFTAAFVVVGMGILLALLAMIAGQISRTSVRRGAAAQQASSAISPMRVRTTTPTVSSRCLLNLTGSSTTTPLPGTSRKSPGTRC